MKQDKYVCCFCHKTILVIATAVFISCILIDISRELLYKKLGVKKKLSAFEDRLLSKSKETEK